MYNTIMQGIFIEVKGSEPIVLAITPWNQHSFKNSTMELLQMINTYSEKNQVDL